MNTLTRDMLKPDTLKAAAAELVGTFFLALAALISGTPYAVGLTLVVFVYAFGNISGCNINPAVTVGLMAARRLPLATGIVYIVAQVVGALLARALAPSVAQLPSYAAATFVGEFLGFGFLMLAVIADSDNYVPKSGSGIAIGGALAAGLVTTKGILNPAIAIAMGQIFSAASWAPLISAVVFSRLFLLFAPKTPEQEKASGASDSDDESSKPKQGSESRPKPGSESKPASGTGSRRPSPARGNGATGKRTSSTWRPKSR